MNCRYAVTLRALNVACLLVLSTMLGGCVTGLELVKPVGATPETGALLQDLPPTDVLLLGEQHDAPAHQARQREVMDALQARGQLAALVIEMAETGGSTVRLPPDANETEAQAALRWRASAAAGWDWAVYGPMVMQALRAGVPVWGGNLPRADIARTMQDSTLDVRLSPDAWRAQQAQIREGHCGLLPGSQVVPMARVQVARDLAMAHTVQAAVRPGQTVLLVSGNQHARRDLGVPQHLAPALRTRSVIMVSGDPSDAGEMLAGDMVWRTAALPERDHCAEFKAQMGKR